MSSAGSRTFLCRVAANNLLLFPIITTTVWASRFANCESERNTQNSGKKVRDPFACGNPICNDKMNMFKMAQEQVSQQPKKGEKPTETSKTAQPISPEIEEESEKIMLQCPLDKNELGRCTWSLLHTMAAYYPEAPTDEQQMAAQQFILSLSILYPCPHCAEDFRANIKLNPPRVGTKDELSVWVCQQHNEVNKKLEKPVVACDMAQLDGMWRKGVKGCWNYSEGSTDDEDSYPLTSGLEKEEAS